MKEQFVEADIYAKKGYKVIGHFINGKLQGGYDGENERASKHIKEGVEYTIETTDVAAWHTDFYLQEFPGISFNSVHFLSAQPIAIPLPEKEASTQPVEDDGFDYYYRKRMRFGEYTNWLHCSKNVYDELPEFLRMKKLKVDKQVVKESETFEDYMRNSRDAFVTAVNEQKWDNQLRIKAEDLLICFDQMREKILAQPSDIK